MHNSSMGILALLVVFPAMCIIAASQAYGMTKCKDCNVASHTVAINGEPIAVHAARHSAMPVNIRWPGHQRELDQTEICYFARFDFRGETLVQVSVPDGTREIVVRPVAKKVAVSRKGKTATFRIGVSGAYSVEFDGRHRNLMIFADPPHNWSDIDRKSVNVRWFGAGEHDVGIIRPKAGETIFLEEGAVVYGRIEARDADGLRICGKGILDSSRVREVPVPIDPKQAEEQRRKGWAITNVKRFDAIRLMFCDDVRIEGITVRDSQIYAIRPVCCDRFTVDNVKILGSWRYNSDGIDMHNCRHVRIRDSFVRTFDDSICVKGFDYVLPESEMLHDGVLHDVFEDVLVERCTIWNDWGHALEIGAETRAREIRNIVFRDCDVLALNFSPLDVQNCDYAHIHDVVFENIRVEYDPNVPRTVFSASAKDFDPVRRGTLTPLIGVIIQYVPEYSKDGAENRGRTSGVAFRNIDVFAPSLPSGYCLGFDSNHRVSDISFSGIRLNGRDETAAYQSSVNTNAFVELSMTDAEEYLTVIRPGKADGSGFWNANARWFMYSPAFAFKPVEGAFKYRFRVLDDLHRVHVFEASAPTAPLTPVWLELPTGYVTVTCEGLAADGAVLGKAGERTFWKAAGFVEGAYGKRACSYRDAAVGVYRYVCNMKETDYLLEQGCPDPSYELNTYVSKMFAALINAMLDYSRLEPKAADRAMKVARAAAEHLIRKSEPADAPLAYFPPTYDGRGEKDNNYRAEQFKGQIMLVYPAQVAVALAALYERTQGEKYLNHAVHIAETYLRLQGEDGVWYLKMFAKDGKPVNPNRLVPIESVVPMFERLYRLTGKESYRQAADRAFASVDRTRLVDWNWEGQFEDVEPTTKYVNLTKHGACSTAIYLRERFPNDSRRLAQMRELLRFSEDQFVCWEPPFKNGRFDRKEPVWSGSYDVWQTPCALEQYHCHWPIDASAAKMIRTYLALYRAEGHPVDLAKARALGDTATRMQCPNGRIPTWWWPSRAKLVYADWINCMIATAQALSQLAEYDDR